MALRRHPPLASCPDFPEGSSSASCCQTLRTFRPCRSSRLRRLAPRAAPQVCCTLQPAMGFERFPSRPPRTCVSTCARSPRLSHARSSHPSKPFPPYKPRRVTATVAISPSSCALFPASSPRPHGFAPAENPLLADPVSRASQPDASLAFVPLQGAPLDTAAHWTAPERRRRSGFPLGDAHRSRRALNAASAEASALRINDSHVPVYRPHVVRLSTVLVTRASPAPACRPTGQPAIELPERPLLRISPGRADTVGVLPFPSLRSRDHLGSRWRLLHVSPESWREAMTRVQKLSSLPSTGVFGKESRSAATFAPSFIETNASCLRGRRGPASRLPSKRMLGCGARCGAADLLGVFDVKDLMG